MISRVYLVTRSTGEKDCIFEADSEDLANSFRASVDQVLCLTNQEESFRTAGDDEDEDGMAPRFAVSSVPQILVTKDASEVVSVYATAPVAVQFYDYTLRDRGEVQPSEPWEGKEVVLVTPEQIERLANNPTTPVF
jgi:hypothetical protein